MSVGRTCEMAYSDMGMEGPFFYGLLGMALDRSFLSEMFTWSNGWFCIFVFQKVKQIADGKQVCASAWGYIFFCELFIETGEGLCVGIRIVLEEFFYLCHDFLLDREAASCYDVGVGCGCYKGKKGGALV